MDEDIRTIWCGNLSEKVTEDLLYELFTQGGPVQKVSIPKDRDGKQKTFGFVTFKHEVSVPYALDLFDGTALFNRTLNMKSRNNSLENNQYQQQQQQQQQYSFHHKQHQIAELQNRQFNIQNQMQLRQQILLGAIAPLAFAQNTSYMQPGSRSYPSQNSYIQGAPSSRDSGNNRSGGGGGSTSRHHTRNHPYRDQYSDRYDKHQDVYTKNNRDQKSHKHSSSHRSNRHDNRRNHR